MHGWQRCILIFRLTNLVFYNGIVRTRDTPRSMGPRYRVPFHQAASWHDLATRLIDDALISFELAEESKMDACERLWTNREGEGREKVHFATKESFSTWESWNGSA